MHLHRGCLTNLGNSMTRKCIKYQRKKYSCTVILQHPWRSATVWFTAYECAGRNVGRTVSRERLLAWHVSHIDKVMAGHLCHHYIYSIVPIKTKTNVVKLTRRGVRIGWPTMLDWSMYNTTFPMILEMSVQKTHGSLLQVMPCALYIILMTRATRHIFRKSLHLSIQDVTVHVRIDNSVCWETRKSFDGQLQET